MSDSASVSTRRQRTRERLLSGAREVIARRGIPGASVEEICEEAGFTRGAFYSNFADKDALLRALFEDFCSSISDVVDLAVARHAGYDGLERLRRCVEEVGSSLPTRRSELLVLRELELHALRAPEFQEFLTEFKRRSTAVLTARVGEEVRAAGLEFRVGDATAFDLLAGAYEWAENTALEDAPPEAEEITVDLSAVSALLIAITRPVEA